MVDTLSNLVYLYFVGCADINQPTNLQNIYLKKGRKKSSL